jgi:hypothetical protein
LRRQWKVTRDNALKTHINSFQRSETYRPNKGRNKQWSDTLEYLDSEDQSLLKMTKGVMRVPTPSSPLQVPGGPALLDSENAEALAHSLVAHFQPVNDPSDLPVVEMFNEAMRAYEYAPQVNRN